MRFRKKYKTHLSQTCIEKRFRKNVTKNFIEKVNLSRKSLSVKILRSFLYPRFAKVFKFSKKSILDKSFRKPSDFEIYCSKSNFEKLILNKIIEIMSFSISFSQIAKKLEFLEKILIQESFEFDVKRTFVLRISYPMIQACHKDLINTNQIQSMFTFN